MIQMFNPQKRRNVGAEEIDSPRIDASPPRCAYPGHSATTNVFSASPPMNVWMPNHPHATIARSTAGTFAPAVPNEDRASTGNGIPSLVPGCALRRIGASTITFPRPMVSSACHQFIPTDTSPPASMYVGMQWAMEIHSAAKLYVVQFRRAGGTGARSGLNSGLLATSGGSSARASATCAGSCMAAKHAPPQQREPRSGPGEAPRAARRAAEPGDTPVVRDHPAGDQPQVVAGGGGQVARVRVAERLRRPDVDHPLDRLPHVRGGLHGGVQPRVLREDVPQPGEVAYFVGERVLHVGGHAVHALPLRRAGRRAHGGEEEVVAVEVRGGVQLDVRVEDVPGLEAEGGGGQPDGEVRVVPAPVAVGAVALVEAGVV